MKNRYLTKYLCLSLAAAMVLAGPLPAFGSEGEDLLTEYFADLNGDSGGSSDFSQDETRGNEAPAGDLTADPTPAPEDTADPTPTPGHTADPTPIPDETVDPTPTPDGSISPTPTPGDTTDPTPTPDGSISPTPTPGETVNPTPTPDGSISSTPTPGETVNPTPTPDGSISPTPTPGETVNPTPTPDGSISPTPTPGETVNPTPTPDGSISPTPTPEEGAQKISEIIAAIDALAAVQPLTLEHQGQILWIRQEYNALSDDEKVLITNYQVFVGIEESFAQLFPDADMDAGFDEENPALELTDGTAQLSSPVQVGTPVYYTGMVSNLHAGKEFYLDSLKQNYQLEFSEDFAQVMEQIETEYKEKNKLVDASDMTGVTSSMDSLLVRNWQDILAVYIARQVNSGVTKDSYYMDASTKDALAEIFAEMNPVVRDKEDITRVGYGNYRIDDYIEQNQVSKEEQAILQKYVETDCKLLCAIVTAAKGFVRESVGDDVSEERVNVIADAYSLVGKVGYFWGGKSNILGEDPSWGSAAVVTAEGSNSTGTLRAYGLDCSGFVTWAVINGYDSVGMQNYIGNGTTDQWLKANVVSEEDAQPGDLVFQRGPEAGSDNHVGIICGKTDAGDWIAVHCSSSQNGVTVGEAYSAGFRYIRQPSFYPSTEEFLQMQSQQFSAGEVLEAEAALENNLMETVKVTMMEAFPEFTAIQEYESLTDKISVEIIPMEAME